MKKIIKCPICAENIDEDTKLCPYCHEKVQLKHNYETSKVVEENVTTTNLEQTRQVAQDERYQEKLQIGDTLKSLEQPQERPIPNNENGASIFTTYFTDIIVYQYADFKGSMTRRSFLLLILCYSTINIFTLSLESLLCLDPMGGGYFGSLFIATALFIPLLAAYFRRLNDLGKSKLWFLILLIPIVGSIWFFILMCKKGHAKDNQITKVSLPDMLIMGLTLILLIASIIWSPEIEDKVNNEYFQVKNEISNNENIDFGNITEDGDYLIYNNEKYGFDLRCPSDFIPQGESGNRDGQQFYNAEKNIYISVWGESNMNDTFKEHYSETLEYFPNVSYKKIISKNEFGGDIYYISGTDDDGIVFYRKSYYSGHQTGIIYTIELKYPKSQQHTAKKLIETTLKHFPFSK